MNAKIGKFGSVDYQRGYIRGLYGKEEGAAPMNVEEREGYEDGVIEDE